MRGPILMLSSLALFAALDAAGKLLAQDGFGFAQVVMLRYAPVLPVALVLLIRTRTPLFDGSTKLHALRGFAMLFASTGFFLAFANLPLAEGYLVFFTAPFLTMTAAWLVLGEHIPRAAWIWAGVGFAGVVIAVADGVGGGGAWFGYLAALLGTIAYATVATINRMLRTTRGLAPVLFWPGLIGGLALAPAAIATWQPPDLQHVLLMCANSVFWSAATLCIVTAFRHAPASRLAPLEYTALLWAVAIDWLLFAHPPATHVIAGGAVVVLACLMSERAQHRGMP